MIWNRPSHWLGHCYIWIISLAICNLPLSLKLSAKLRNFMFVLVCLLSYVTNVKFLSYHIIVFFLLLFLLRSYSKNTKLDL